MKERVSTIIGKKPIILVAPHGADDSNTAIITETAANKLNCYAVINRGFNRADVVDSDNDIADCNKISHCKEEVVYEEFFKPIIKFKDRLLFRSKQTNAMLLKGKYPTSDPVDIFYIHGCGDIVHKEANEPVGVIIGYGLGIKQDSLTCDPWKKNVFTDIWRNNSRDGDAFEGRGGGRYAGRDANNLNQYFRKHIPDIRIHAMQLEFPYSSRKTETEAAATGLFLAQVLERFITFNSYEMKPKAKFI